MIKKLLLFLVTLSFLISSYASQIYHGDKATSDDQFPFVVAVYSTDHCSGTVIDKNWVLTALHCVAQYDDNYYITGFTQPEFVSIGLGYRAGDEKSARKIIPVKEIHALSKIGDPLFLHDFALLKLSSPADVPPVNLPDSNSFSELKLGHLNTIASGFGVLDVKWHDKIPEIVIDEFLHYGKEQIQPDDIIQELNKKYEIYWPDTRIPQYNSQTMLGTLSADGQPTTNGDSGGPLLIQQEENHKISYTQIGVVSWSLTPFFDYKAYEEKIFGKVPDIYTNLTYSNHLDFIKKTIKNNS